MEKTEKVDPRILAGEFVLADADGDIDKASAILARVLRGEISSMQMLMAMNLLAVEALKVAFGDEWRSALNEVLLRLSVEGVTGDEQ